MQEREAITLLLACGVGMFVVYRWRELRQVPNYGWLILSFAFVTGHYTFSLIESLVWNELFNSLQHGSSFCGTLAIAIWTGKTFRRRETA